MTNPSKMAETQAKFDTEKHAPDATTSLPTRPSAIYSSQPESQTHQFPEKEEMPPPHPTTTSPFLPTFVPLELQVIYWLVSAIAVSLHHTLHHHLPSPHLIAPTLLISTILIMLCNVFASTPIINWNSHPRRTYLFTFAAALAATELAFPIRLTDKIDYWGVTALQKYLDNEGPSSSSQPWPASQLAAIQFCLAYRVLEKMYGGRPGGRVVVEDDGRGATAWCDCHWAFLCDWEQWRWGRRDKLRRVCHWLLGVGVNCLLARGVAWMLGVQGLEWYGMVVLRGAGCLGRWSWHLHGYLLKPVQDLGFLVCAVGVEGVPRWGWVGFGREGARMGEMVVVIVEEPCSEVKNLARTMSCLISLTSAQLQKATELVASTRSMLP